LKILSVIAISLILQPANASLYQLLLLRRRAGRSVRLPWPTGWSNRKRPHSSGAVERATLFPLLPPATGLCASAGGPFPTRGKSLSQSRLGTRPSRVRRANDSLPKVLLKTKAQTLSSPRTSPYTARVDTQQSKRR